MVMLWFSAVASAIVDNIPYVATMNPLIVDMARQIWPGLSGAQLVQHPDLMPVWWSLALGACLGGNGTPIGASANVIVVGIAEQAEQAHFFVFPLHAFRHAGHGHDDYGGYRLCLAALLLFCRLNDKPFLSQNGH
jgi:hypothetical protein